MTGMGKADIVIGVVLVLFAARGFLRGFLREAFGVVALVGGLLAALQFADPLAALVGEYVELDPVTRTAGAFVLLFVVVHLGVNLTGFLLDRLLRSFLFRSINRAGGTVFGVLKGAVFLSFILLFLQVFPLVPSLNKEMERSRIARPLATAAGAVLRDSWRRPVIPHQPPEM